MINRTLHLSTIFIFICSLFTYSIATHAKTTLSQVEYDLLKVRMADQLKNESYDEALNSIAQIKSSGFKYSPTLIYFEGYTFQQLGQLTAAKSAFLAYLEKAGSKGKYYQKALQNIVTIETELDGVLQRYKNLLAKPPTNESLAQIEQLERKLGDTAKPLRAEFDKQQLAAAKEAKVKALIAEKQAKIKAKAEQERLAEEAKIAAEIAKNPPKVGTITSIDTVWNFVVISLNDTELVKSGDIVKARAENQSTIDLTIKKISSMNASATVDGEISIIKIGMDVYKW
jgi:hypothetical protein